MNMNPGARAANLERQAANLIKQCRVAEIDPQTGKVRLEDGTGFVSGWVSINRGQSGRHLAWSMPKVGELGMLLSPSGQTEQGVFMPGLYSQNGSQPNTDASTWLMQFEDGSTIKVEPGRMTIQAAGVLNLIAGGDMYLQAAHIHAQEGTG